MKRLIEMMILAPIATLAVPVLIDSAFKGALLLALTLAAMLLLRRSSSALRHAVLVSAMALLLVLPVLSLTLPGWRILPAWANIAPLDAVPSRVEAAAPPVVEFASDYPVPGNLAGAFPNVTAVGAPAPENDTSGWIPLVIWAWSIGAILLGLRLTFSQIALWHLGRKARHVQDPQVNAMALQLKRDLGIGRQVEVLLHPGRTMPMTWGIFKSRLLLPTAAEGWDEIQLRAVLLHELAHIRRGDSRTQLLVQLTCAVHWFNPLAWIAACQIATERERACDDLVLNSGIRASDYAEQLLRIATGYETRPVASMSAVAMAKRSRLEGRVTSILNKRVDRRSITRRVAVGVGCGLALLAMPVAMMQAVGQDEANVTSEKEVQASGGVERTGDAVIPTERDTLSYEDGFIGISEAMSLFLRPDAPQHLSFQGPEGWTNAADISIDDLIEADAAAGSRPVQTSIQSRSEAEEYQWLDKPTDLATDTQNLRGIFRSRHEHDDTSVETPPETQYRFNYPATKVGTPIFKREFLGGARNLRRYDFHQATDREPTEPETPDDLNTTGSGAMLTRKFLKTPDGQVLYVDLDPSKLSDSYGFEGLVPGGARIEPQPDNVTNLTRKFSVGTFALLDHVRVDRFDRTEVLLGLTHSTTIPSGWLGWLDEPVDLLSSPQRPATFVRGWYADLATITPIESPDLLAVDPRREPSPATAQSYVEKYPDNRRMQQQAEIRSDLQAERARLSTTFKTGSEIMKQNEQRIGLLEAGIIRLGEEIDQKIIDLGELPDRSSAGIGMMLSRTEGEDGLVIHDLLDGGPAARAGTVRKGDRIVGFSDRKNGKWVNTTKMDLVEAVNLIRGKAGSPVRLKVLREDGGKKNLHEITLIRERLHPAPADPNPGKPELGEPVLLQLKNAEAKAAKAAVDAVIGGSDRGRVFADERSNSLIYLGDDETLKLVRSMLEWLDQEQ